MIIRIMLWAVLAIVLVCMTACGGPSTPTPTPIPTISPEAEISVKLAVSEALQTQPSEIEIISSQRQDWPDACLGLGQSGETCAAGVVSGWLMLVEFEDVTYKVRANDDGSIVRIASPMP